MFKCAKIFHDKYYNIEGSLNENVSNISETIKQGNEASSITFLDRAFIRRWKTKIYRYLEKDKCITQINFSNYSEESIEKMVMQKFKNEYIRK
jgi:hypothetical protein